MSISLRNALRQFRRHPSFALVTVLVLGLGTGAAITVYGLVDGLLLRPLPYAQPDRLVTLWDTNVETGRAHDPISPVNFMDYRALPVFADAAAWWRPSVNLADPGLDPVRVPTIETSGNLFDVLGVRPQVGAGFPAGGPLFHATEMVAVISDRLWRTRYGADPAIVGRQLSLNGTPYTVLGVMPPRFAFPGDVDVWERLRWDPTQHSRAAHFMESVARLAPSGSLAGAQAACDALAVRLGRDFAQTNRAWGTRLVPLLDQQLGYYRPALLVLFGAVALLLVVACLNIASLMLTRAIARQREVAVRIALGASRGQLAALLLGESAAVSTAGVALGTLVAAGALPLLAHFAPVQIPRLDEARVGGGALLLGAGFIVATTLFFGLLPALALLRGRPAQELRASGRGASLRGRRIYSLLVVGEVALAFALLIGSALLVRTVERMMATPTGVDADAVVLTSVQLGGAAYGDWRVVADTHRRILETVRLQPGVESAGATNFLPYEAGWRGPFAVEGQPPPVRPEDAPQTQTQSVSEGYFETMRAERVAGRFFAATDTATAPPVVVVNETFAHRFLADDKAVGRGFVTFSRGVGPLGVNLMAAGRDRHQPLRFEVIGVVRDVRNAPLGQPVEPAVYFTERQFPFREQTLAVRAADRATALAVLRTALREVAPGVPLGTVETWGERRAARTAEQRLLTMVLVTFGAVAAVLAALGVYGLLSWSVALRTRELAIRVALGARPRTLAVRVVGQSALLLAGGLLAGALLVRVAQGLLARVLYGVAVTDGGALAQAAALLLGIGLAACLAPARRAMTVDPAEGLRAE